MPRNQSCPSRRRVKARQAQKLRCNSRFQVIDTVHCLYACCRQRTCTAQCPVCRSYLEDAVSSRPQAVWQKGLQVQHRKSNQQVQRQAEPIQFRAQVRYRTKLRSTIDLPPYLEGQKMVPPLLLILRLCFR